MRGAQRVGAPGWWRRRVSHWRRNIRSGAMYGPEDPMYRVGGCMGSFGRWHFYAVSKWRGSSSEDRRLLFIPFRCFDNSYILVESQRDSFLRKLRLIGCERSHGGCKRRGIARARAWMFQLQTNVDSMSQRVHRGIDGKAIAAGKPGESLAARDDKDDREIELAPHVLEIGEIFGPLEETRLLAEHDD